MKYIKDEEEILNIRRNLKKNKNFWFDIKQNRTQRQLLHLRKRRKKDNDDDKRKKKTKQKENTKDIYFLIVYNETVNHMDRKNIDVVSFFQDNTCLEILHYLNHRKTENEEEEEKNN